MAKGISGFLSPYFSFTLVVLLIACTTVNPAKAQHVKKMDIQGHRGARGLFPENTITAFLEAVKMGVTTLEMDVVVSQDSQLVVSHEAWMNAAFCIRPDGERVEENSRERYNLYRM